MPPTSPTKASGHRAPTEGEVGAADPLEAVLREPVEIAAPGENSESKHHRSAATSTQRAQRDEFLAALQDEPCNFDFYQVVRRLGAVGDEPGVGLSDRFSEDPLRFCQQPTLAFPPASISKYAPARGNAPARLFVNFLGLLGPHGPLPLHLAEYAHERELHAKDFTFSRFLDLFNHRLVSLFYRAWSVNQMPASFDRSMSAAGVDQANVKLDDRLDALLKDEDRFAVYVGALFGVGMESLRLRDPVPDTAKLFFAGRMAAAAPGPEGLRSILADYFGVDANIEEFAGHWLELPKDCNCRLGFKVGEDRSASSLGGMGLSGAVAGSRVWDCQGKFRIKLGPMTLGQYKSMLPHTPAARRIESWIRNFVGDEFAWEVTLILRDDEVPRTQLGGGAALGWLSWSYSGKCPEHRADMSLRSRN